MPKVNWIKQIYLSLLPAFPAGYLVVHGFRGEQPWTKIYVTRSDVPPTQNLRDIVDSELDNLTDAKNPKVLITCTDDLEPKVYGGFFLSTGAEIQFPLRVTCDDVEMARRLGSNLELDLGFARHRRKIEVNSTIGDELISRMMLSDAAKRFIVQRQLLLANSGTYFCVPMFAWFGIFGVGYGLLLGLYPVVGGLGAFFITVSAAGAGFRQFLKGFEAYKIRNTDLMVMEKDESYLQGARDYFKSGLAFNRMLRKILGESGEQDIKKNGDFKIDKVPYSERLKNIESFIRSKQKSQKLNLKPPPSSSRS